VSINIPRIFGKGYNIFFLISQGKGGKREEGKVRWLLEEKPPRLTDKTPDIIDKEQVSD